ncbi:hypothetical protein OG689_04005 [Kitasatospora sp. NBC_00240]|uniref:hypothetical protein n=1 Tax=Kitasatospora sp. NBC_00240 TaxID=2903567 RepID=UPI00224E9B10|nr:hypothetical protein [Kitasatospora sp. NBC_00240]MCX5208466.1 hypothetical protein [Kitasatospora sp. NBC_00240]
MLDTAVTPTTRAGSTALPYRPAAPWAVRVAKVAALTAVPSGLWRIALGVGVPVGFSGATEQQMTAHMPGWGTLYVLALSALAETLAFLSLGLVRPWGRVTPRWLPLIGGRRVHPRAAVIPAGLGALAVTAITFAAGFGGWYGPDAMGSPEAPHGLAGLTMTLCYAPLLLWGPLLAVVTVDYHRRSRAGSH